MVDVSVILPTYNERANITALVQRVAEVLKAQKKTFEILVVDDHSPDGTADLIRRFGQKHQQFHVRIIERMKNHGLGLSILDGVEQSKGEVIIGMDADFNHDPKYIPLLLRRLETARLVVGSRFLPGGGMSESWRMIPTFLFNLFFRLVGFPIMDNTSGFYAIRARDVQQLRPRAIYYGYGEYHLRLVYAAKISHYDIAEIPVYYGSRLGGSSKSRFAVMTLQYVREAIRLSLQSPAQPTS